MTNDKIVLRKREITITPPDGEPLELDVVADKTRKKALEDISAAKTGALTDISDAKADALSGIGALKNQIDTVAAEVNSTADKFRADADAGKFKGEKGDKGDPGSKGDKGDPGDKGEPGEKGDAFKYSDFTPEQLAALKGTKGDKGDKGEKGEKGDAFTYSDFTAEQLAALKGEKGDKGEPGQDGTGVTVDVVEPTASAITGQASDAKATHDALETKLNKSGGTMTGALTLSGAPTEELQAATKKYVDDYVAANTKKYTAGTGIQISEAGEISLSLTNANGGSF